MSYVILGALVLNTGIWSIPLAFKEKFTATQLRYVGAFFAVTFVATGVQAITMWG